MEFQIGDLVKLKEEPGIFQHLIGIYLGSGPFPLPATAKVMWFGKEQPYVAYPRIRDLCKF
jgi:hypothetical protein